MFQGCLSDESKGAVLQLDDPIDTGNEQTTVRDIPASKHPPGQPAHPDAVIDDDPLVLRATLPIERERGCSPLDDPPEIHPVLFESLDAAMIRSSASGTLWC